MTIKTLPDPRVLLAETDWNTLGADWAQVVEECPGGPVSLTPMALAALTSGDRALVDRALNHLGGTLLHQESLYGETGTAALYIAALLADPGSQPALNPDWRIYQQPLRANLLWWLANVADTVSDHEEQARKRYGFSWETLPTAQEIRALRPVLYQAVAGCLNDPDPMIAEAALGAAVPLLDDPALVHLRPVLAPRVRRELAVSAERGWRFVAIRGLRAWGQDTSSLAAHAEVAEYEEQMAQRSASGTTEGEVEWVSTDPPF
ncbi:hypothetical protein ACSNOI_32465 [Actinomadura kijaniata]|uniref:hypothetical protein n=1 Tax=Actinomadura kijaniata TaxID=46161 RepID=UPI003F1CAB30